MEKLDQKHNKRSYVKQTVDSSNLEEMVEIFTKNVNDALDEVAPFKQFTVKSQFKFGLTDETKELMAKRDNVRKNLCKNHIT